MQDNRGVVSVLYGIAVLFMSRFSLFIVLSVSTNVKF